MNHFGKRERAFLSGICFALAYLCFLVYFISQAMTGDFLIGDIVWLIIDIPLFGLGVYGLFAHKETFSIVSLFSLFAFNSINGIVNGASGLSSCGYFFADEADWPLGVVNITYFISMVCLCMAFVFFVLVVFFKNNNWAKAFDYSQWGAVFFSLLTLIFVCIDVSTGSYTWGGIFNGLMYPLIFLGLLFETDGLLKKE